MEQSQIVNCLVCYKELHKIIDTQSNAYNATAIRFHSGYGSQFEGMHGWFFVCDECLSERLGNVYVTNYNSCGRKK